MGVDEEEAWLNEKTTLVSSEEVGDTLAAVQVGGVVRVMGARVYRCYLLSNCMQVCMHCHATDHVTSCDVTVTDHVTV